MRKRGLACLLLLLVTLPGCWSRLEINDFGAVIGMAVDKGEGAPIRLTMYVARSLGGGKDDNPRWIASREAATIPDAWRKISLASSRRISLQHVRVILMGEEYARNGIGDLMDFLSRNAEVRLTARPLLVKGKAHPLLATAPELESLQPENLIKIFEAKGGLDPTIKDLLVAIPSDTHSGWLYTSHVVKKPSGAGVETELAGLALLLRDRLRGFLDGPESQALTWLLKNPRQTEFTAPCPDQSGGVLSVRVAQGSARIVPSVVNEEISFTVKTKGRVQLMGSGCTRLDVVNPAQRQQLEEVVAGELTRQLVAVTQKLQRMGVDPAGFGKRLQLRYPALYRRIKQDWPTIWSRTTVRYATRITIHHSGLVIEPATRAGESQRH